MPAFAFSLNDLGIKFLSGDYPLHQIVLIRATVGLCFTLAIFHSPGGRLPKSRKTKRLGMHFLRGLFVVFANMTFFLGLAAIPLSEATAIFFVSPLVITLFSVCFSGERVGPWRWFAVASGLLGASSCCVREQAPFSMPRFFRWCGAVGYASLHILTRKMGVTEKASTMAFYIQLTFIFVSAVIGLAIR